MSSVYRISESGACARVLAALRLGNQPTPSTSDDEIRLKYYSMLEEICAQKLADEGLILLPSVESVKCNICKNNDGSEKSGIHVEIHTDLIDFIGHLDRRVQLKSGVYPLEIKCLGRFTFQKWLKDTFKVYPGYASQEVCYLEAEKKSGLYVVMNRDTGDLAKYTVNDYEKKINLDGFVPLTLPITFEQVCDRLVNIEIEVSNGVLPKGDSVNEQTCSWCNFRYLCSPTNIVEKKMAIVNAPALLDAASQYKDGDMYFKLGQDMKDSAKLALYEHAKQQGTGEYKYRVADISVIYRGQTQRKTYDAKILEKLVDSKILKKAERLSAPYDDGTIRIIKSKDEGEQ